MQFKDYLYLCLTIVIAATGCDSSSLPATTQGLQVDAEGCPDPELVDAPVELTQYVAVADDFDCLIEQAQIDKPAEQRWYSVRNFKIKNMAGRTQEALDVACGRQPAPYPIGTFVQLIPLESMVKRGGNFSPEGNDWEFFFLQPLENESGSGTEINTRGATETTSPFDANCFSCHREAKPEADFLCEQENGCDPIAAAKLADNVRQGDVRCKPWVDEL